MVLAEVWQSVAVGVPVCVLCTKRVKAPVVATREGVTHPSSMLDLPTVGHTVPVRVGVGGVGAGVDVGERQIGGVGYFALGTVAEVIHLNGIIAPEVALLEEEAVVFRAVANPVPVGVADAGVG